MIYHSCEVSETFLFFRYSFYKVFQDFDLCWSPQIALSFKQKTIGFFLFTWTTHDVSILLFTKYFNVLTPSLRDKHRLVCGQKSCSSLFSQMLKTEGVHFSASRARAELLCLGGGGCTCTQCTPSLRPCNH